MACRAELAVLTLVLALGWGFWLQRMGVNDHDDALSNELIFAREPIAALVSRIPWADQSPLYFLALHAARRLGEGSFTIQLLNALLLTVTLASTHALARACGASRTAALAAVLLGATSPASLWLVRNGRMYSLQVLLSVLSLLVLLRYLDRHRTRDLVALGLLCLLNVYIHFIGFLITGILFLPLLADAGSEYRRRLRQGRGPGAAWRPLLQVGLVALGILVLSLPQVLRLGLLVDGGLPLRAGRSLPPLSRAFLDRVSWHWFVNSDWGALRASGRRLAALYLGTIGVLVAAGLAAARRRIAAVAGLWIGLPVLALGLAAARLDVRDRHFVWVLPLLWIVIANGALAPLPSARLAGAAGDIARGVRAALFLAVLAASIWLLRDKLPERSPQWTKLMLGLQQVYRPSMVVDMPPGPETGPPRFLGAHLDLPAGLRDIGSLNAQTRDRFERQVGQGREFIFLAQGGFVNEEMRWRALYLQERGYRRSVLQVWGAQAQLFTLRDVDGFARGDRIEPMPSRESVVAWVRRRLRDRRISPSGAPRLAAALVARVGEDGTAREGRLFMSQRGESGSWRLGPTERDAVDEVRTSSHAIERAVILTHPAEDILVLGFGALEMKSTLDLLYGIPDSGLRFGPGGGVAFAVYVDGAKRIDTVAPSAPGWQELELDTRALRGKTTDVVLLLTAADRRARDFAFRLATSSGSAPGGLLDEDQSRSAPVVLGGGRNLKDSLDRLTVYRLAGGGVLPARRDPRGYTAREMHEAGGAAGEGGLAHRWALGPALWDAVGLSRQRSGGETREGLWAHPRDGTTLVIESPRAVMRGGMLRGYFGLTDFSVARAAERGIVAPVRLRISVDGVTLLEREAPRERGWKTFAAPIPGDRGERRLRVEIACARDSWAHFVFDLWSD